MAELQQLYVIYVNYGSHGMTYRTGPVELRHRVGLWMHTYRRVHPANCQCLRCFERVAAGPTPKLPPGRTCGHMYPLFHV